MKKLYLCIAFAVAILFPGVASAQIVLQDTNDTLEVVTGSAVTTIHIHATWADVTTTTFTEGSTNSLVTTAVTTTAVAAPGASTRRHVKLLTVYNSHASSSNAISVQMFDGTNRAVLMKYTLLAGESLQYDDNQGFKVVDANGQIKGLVAATQSGTWNVTNISGTVSLPTGAATAALQDGIIKDGTGDTTQANVIGGRLQVENYNANLAADNSTNSTSKVPVLAGVATTAAPTYTTTNQVPLSLQTDGSLRAAVTNNVTIGTFPDNEPFNVAQMNGVAVSMGVGASGTGTQRVASLIHDGTDTAQVTATAGGSLQVECTSGCGGSGGTSIADDAAFTPGTTAVTPAGAMFDDVTPDSVNEGDAGVLRMSANRNLYSTIRDAAGNERGANVNASNELMVAATGTVTANAGTNLNTSALLTTSAHDAAIATAGSPDAQVRSIQGIASGTPVGVQSNGANLATEASVDGLEGGLGAAADAAATAGSTGSVTAKLRLMTSQLDAIQTAVQLIDDDQTGASMFHKISVGTTEDEHEVKGSAGRLFSISATNTNAAVRYLRCANQVIGSTTPGTTSVWFGLAIPGSTTGGGFTHTFGPAGVAFSTGLTCWLVTGAAETDVAEVAANEINVNYVYK